MKYESLNQWFYTLFCNYDYFCYLQNLLKSNDFYWKTIPFIFSANWRWPQSVHKLSYDIASVFDDASWERGIKKTKLANQKRCPFQFKCYNWSEKGSYEPELQRISFQFPLLWNPLNAICTMPARKAGFYLRPIFFHIPIRIRSELCVFMLLV